MPPITTLQVDRDLRDEVKEIADKRGLKLYRFTTDVIRLGVAEYMKQFPEPLGTPVAPCTSRPESFSNTNPEGK